MDRWMDDMDYISTSNQQITSSSFYFLRTITIRFIHHYRRCTEIAKIQILHYFIQIQQIMLDKEKLCLVSMLAFIAIFTCSNGATSHHHYFCTTYLIFSHQIKKSKKNQIWQKKTSKIVKNHTHYHQN